MRILLLGLTLAGLADAQVAPPASASGWNRLTVGGYGERTGAPLCRAIAYFKALPQRLDVENDLRWQKAGELTDEVTINQLRAVNSPRIYEIVHMVQSSGWKSSKPELFLKIKLLLVERAHDEFCDLYQYQELDAAVFFDGDMHEARILSINGKHVLKSIIQDMRSYATAYWAVDGQEPILLSTRPITAAIRDTAPKGSRWSMWFQPINLTGKQFKLNVLSPSEGNDILGTVEVDLDVEGKDLTVLGKRWIPAYPAAVK